MAVDRRTFLGLLGPAVLLPGVPFPACADGASDALFLIVDGIAADTPAGLFRAFTDPFLADGLPIAIIPTFLRGAEATLSPVLAGEVGRLFAAAPHLAEPVLSLPGLGGLSRYFQRRAASDALEWMRTLIGATPAAVPPPVTVATDAAPSANLDVLRCLGIRSVLTLTAAETVTSTGCADRTVCLRGSRRLSLADTADPARWLEDALEGPGWRQIVLSLAGIERLAAEDVHLRARQVCDAVGREIGSGRRFAALPRDHARWFGDDQMRFVAVRLRPGTAASAASMARFRADIEALGIPVTDTVRPEDETWAEGLCAAPVLPWAGGAGAWGFPRPQGLRCIAADAGAATLPAGLGQSIDLLLMPGADPAFDGRGLFLRGETGGAGIAALRWESRLMRDAVISLGPEDCASDVARGANLAALRRLREDTGTRFLDIPAFHAATVTPDPVFDLLHDARRDPADAADPDALSTAELMNDARQAWTFFERFSVAATGLCIDTADVRDGEEWLQREMTMWDIGSLVAAVMAAHDLDLIGDSAFVARCARIVEALPVARIGGLRLPAEVISPDSGAALSGDFNACDTGRLLSVLGDLDRHPLTRGIAEPKIAGWDLAGVVIGGHVHSVVNGRFVDRFRSHCAHYTARAFRGRGIDAASPYEVMGEGPQTDRDMRLLEALAGLDPLGAEPLLLEAVEMGLSEPTALLAEVLSFAQRRDHERTGTLYCVSEAPINRAPWFSYQGLNVASATERWVVNAASADPRFNTPSFREETLLVNTKAAYLWAAARPGAYATMLVRHVRDRARLDGMGFSPGVFVATGQGMPGYADVNTNGIMLAAIAFILRGRRLRQG
ncbi:MAG: DUF3131 domain-containing protein [Albidovulum sp.]|jgi:hypothetical protein|uniref:DUF3131 domain-containing protein n=1 Tax=Albidovulum sp. TaxID=1872424 RepID=UPI003038F819